ncbi:hypothetical protein AC579_2869 [Pseudocercospora musae]|uniref:ABC1 atypical kinase-like domain-containing protein n=1 Tax=Pseudocercospora musae TaxID=113226 RepID=A0A139IU49_9PEZI|nr:hypothetical protein AC579_2869 [Pseudocercospora musae]
MKAVPSPLWTAISRSSTPWTCRQCLQSQRHDAPRLQRSLQQQIPRTQFSTSRIAQFGFSQHARSHPGIRAWSERVREEWEETVRNPRRRKVAIWTTVAFVSFTAALAFSEEARHTYVAAQRCGRVGVVLYLNIADYRKILKREDWDDPKFQEDISACHKRCALRTLHAMEKNGSIFIKLGQHLTSLNYLLPNEWCDTFIPLQDKCPVSSFPSIDEMVKLDTGKSLEDYFSDFAAEPIGAASLAQVHIARLKDSGERVAVKVQHPGLDEWAALDMWLTKNTFRTLKYWFPEYDLTWLSDEMEVSLPKELDFREEGHNAKRMKEYFRDHVPNSPLIIPEVKWADRRILVMEYMTGHRPDDLEYLDANGISRDEVSAALARIFNEMIFGDGAPLHCDPHGGNMAIRVNNNKRKPRNFDIILYDHGLYRDIPQHLRRAYAHMWLAVLDTDIPKMRKYAYEIAGIGDDEFPIFASAITGRDYTVLANDVTKERNAEEKRSLTDQLGEDLIEKLVGMLGRVPRIILLILKTNDLTRSLDENLHTSQGPIRSFLILARYAAHCVYEEQLDNIRGSWIWPSNILRLSGAFFQYAKVALKLRIYEYYLSARRRLGLANVAPPV